MSFIPGLAQWVKNPALPQLAQILSLAHQELYTSSGGKKKKKKVVPRTMPCAIGSIYFIPLVLLYTFPRVVYLVGLSCWPQRGQTTTMVPAALPLVSPSSWWLSEE